MENLYTVEFIAIHLYSSLRYILILQHTVRLKGVNILVWWQLHGHFFSIDVTVHDPPLLDYFYMGTNILEGGGRLVFWHSHNKPSQGCSSTAAEETQPQLNQPRWWFSSLQPSLTPSSPPPSPLGPRPGTGTLCWEGDRLQPSDSPNLPVSDQKYQILVVMFIVLNGQISVAGSELQKAPKNDQPPKYDLIQIVKLYRTLSNMMCQVCVSPTRIPEG